MPKSYKLWLPVFKQGNDVAYQIKKAGGDVVKAFQEQAEMYKEAARLCSRMSEAVGKNPEISIKADTHLISVEGPEEVLAALKEEKLLDYD